MNLAYPMAARGRSKVCHIPEVVIRRLCLGDTAAMAGLESLCFSLPWTMAQCGASLRQQAFRALGAWKGESLIGYISMYCAKPELEVLNLAVHPFERRRGVGERLLRLVLQCAAKMGIENVFLEVRENNNAAIALYRACGFTQVGVRERYYPDTLENALILSKNI